jgi:hypothetical protein
MLDRDRSAALAALLAWYREMGVDDNDPEPAANEKPRGLQALI